MPENFPEVIANSQPAIPIEAGENVPELRKAASRLLRGSAVYGITSFCLKALSFLLLALYTRFLTPADYGKVKSFWDSLLKTTDDLVILKKK